MALAGFAVFGLEAGADTWQDLASIGTSAEQVVAARYTDPAEHVEVSAAPVDPRLRLPACGQPLQAAVPDAAGEASRFSVEVRCDGPRSWRLRVPVEVTVRRALVVTAVPLERGKVLAAGDVILADRVVAAVPGGYLTSTGAAIGQVLRRSLPAGAVIAPVQLTAPVLIRRGQQVTLEAKSGAIAVQMAGIARADGALGEIISVENPSSRRVLQGVVRNEKSVEIRVP